jgi:F-type H+-transporting ATPase subunit epsilon
MQLEVITPDSKILQWRSFSCSIPGIDGSFQLLNGHAPIISALKQGSIKVDLTENFETEEKSSSLIKADSNPKVIHIEIKGGVIEMLNNKVIVLAE